MKKFFVTLGFAALLGFATLTPANAAGAARTPSVTGEANSVARPLAPGEGQCIDPDGAGILAQPNFGASVNGTCNYGDAVVVYCTVDIGGDSPWYSVHDGQTNTYGWIYFASVNLTVPTPIC